MAVQLLKWPGFHLPWIVLMEHISVDTGGLSFYFCMFRTDTSDLLLCTQSKP